MIAQVLKKTLLPLTGFILILISISTGTIATLALKTYPEIFLPSGIIMLVYSILRISYYKTKTRWIHKSNKPQEISLALIDYLKAFICWIDSFRRTYALEPGLYYTGAQFESNSPLIVTANYHLTIFMLLRRLRGINVNLLVIDTDGINVWCAAGKGRFSNSEIQKQISRFTQYLNPKDEKIEIIIPKLAFSGVNLKDLRNANVKPVIGPIHAHEIPAFLKNPTGNHNNQYRVHFTFPERFFTWLPGLMQYLYYSLLVFLFLWIIELVWGIQAPRIIIPLVAFMATAYPLLFPWIPGSLFATKGLTLAFVTSIGYILAALTGLVPLPSILPFIPFIFASGLFIALSYTGNSAVSNYTKVRKEIATFLIPTVGLFLASMVLFLWAY
ncbi:hypothetical protein KKC82_01835 [bacterium]|nr:hypothetical protein [bacterium]